MSKAERRRSMARERYHLQREGWGWNTFVLPEAEAVETATLERCQTTGRWLSRALAAPWPRKRGP